MLEAARSGDEEAFGRLVDPCRGELHAHCYRMLGSVHDAEDALQDTLLRAWRGLAGFEGRSSFRSWLYTIATNACLNLIARRRNRVLPVDYGRSPSPSGWSPTRTRRWVSRTALLRQRRAMSYAKASSLLSSPHCSTCRPISARC